MKERIRQIMESLHMTQGVFADYIGLAPATLSGIFNDRTRPTMNMIEAIKRKIPDIDTDWLIFGTGKMYKSAPAEKPAPPSVEVVPSFDKSDPEPMLDFSVPASPTPHAGAAPSTVRSVARSAPAEIVREEVKYIEKPQRKVTEIRVYYDDQTWESFVPSKK